uniref:Uncharacterized protein n=1 Tax=Ciona intestinalis TaxID=7719 RepID=H2XLL3_CIOIN
MIVLHQELFLLVVKVHVCCRNHLQLGLLL